MQESIIHDELFKWQVTALQRKWTNWQMEMTKVHEVFLSNMNARNQEANKQCLSRFQIFCAVY